MNERHLLCSDLNLSGRQATTCPWLIRQIGQNSRLPFSTHYISKIHFTHLVPELRRRNGRNRGVTSNGWVDNVCFMAKGDSERETIKKLRSARPEGAPVGQAARLRIGS
jgi:hypothetical protein